MINAKINSHSTSPGQLKPVDSAYFPELEILSFMDQNDNRTNNFSIYEECAEKNELNNGLKNNSLKNNGSKEYNAELECYENFFLPSELLALTTDKYPLLFMSSKNKDRYLFKNNNNRKIR